MAGPDPPGSPVNAMRSPLDNAAKFFRLLARKRSAYPEEIQIEVTNACNLQCAMCPHTHGTVPQRDFPLPLFENLVQTNPAPKRLVLTGWGEPLLHPNFFAIIALSNQHWPDTAVRFTTNGILLDEKRREQIKELQVEAVTVSVDLWPDRQDIPREWRDILHPPSPKTFRHLVDYAADQDLMNQTPLILQALVVEENLEDVRRYIHFAAEHSLQAVHLARMQPYPENPVPRPSWEREQAMLAELRRAGREQGVRVRTLNQQSLPLRLATRFDGICLRTDDSVYITVEGTITPCCNLRGYAIGALESTGMTIEEAWRSRKEKEFFENQRPVCGLCDALFHRYRT